jgi:hypothetical protein
LARIIKTIDGLMNRQYSPARSYHFRIWILAKLFAGNPPVPAAKTHYFLQTQIGYNQRMEDPNPRRKFRQNRRWPFDASIAAISAIAIGLLPFAILSFFSNPQADDFDAAITTMRLGYFKSIAFAYSNWNSRWFSSAIMQASPLAFGSIAAYKAVPIILLILFIRALLAFVKAALPDVIRPKEAWVCALALLAVYLSSMSSVAQGFYWMPGAVSYQLANILMLFLWALVTSAMQAPPRKSRKWILTVCSLTLFAIIGSNQTSMILILFILTAALAWRSLQSRRIDGLFAGLLVLAVIASAIVVLAPGNHARMEHVSHAVHPIAVAKESVMVIVRFAMEQVSNPILLLFTLCAIPFFAAKAQNNSACRRLPPLALLFGLWIGSMLVAVIPVIHLFPGWIPERILNITGLLFVIGWFLILNEIIRFWAMKHPFRFASIPGYILAILAVLALLALPGKNNIRIAWDNLRNGSAYRYNRELSQRYEQIKQCAQDTCVVEPLSVFPGMLYYKDIGADATSWPNRPYAEYFGKREIRLGKADIVPGNDERR